MAATDSQAYSRQIVQLPNDSRGTPRGKCELHSAASFSEPLNAALRKPYDPNMRTISRRWFQIHLSTTVVLMVGASILLGLNLVSHEMSTDGEAHDFMQKIHREQGVSGSWLAGFYSQGWPLTFRSVYNINNAGWPDWKMGNLLLDILGVFFILATLAFVSEIVIRRR